MKVPPPGFNDTRINSDAIRQLASGDGNNIVQFTVTANAATTTVDLLNAKIGDLVMLYPTSSASRSEFAFATTYGAVNADGKITVTHPNNSTTGRTYVAIVRRIPR